MRKIQVHNVMALKVACFEKKKSDMQCKEWYANVKCLVLDKMKRVYA